MPMTPDEAIKRFTPLFGDFWGCVEGAFARFFDVNKDELGAIHDRTKSSYINDLIVKNLKLMVSISGAHWEYKQGQRRLWLDGVTCVRIKKVNHNLQPHNLATQAQFDFYQSLVEQQYRLPDPIFAPPTRLVLGYTTNPTRSAPQQLFIISFDGVLNRKIPKGIESIKPKVVWAIEVLKSETSQGAMPMPHLHPPTLPSGEITPRRVRSKKVMKRKQKDTDNREKK